LAKLRESLARRMGSASQEKSWGFSDEPATTTEEVVHQPGPTDKAEKGEVSNRTKDTPHGVSPGMLWGA